MKEKVTINGKKVQFQCKYAYAEKMINVDDPALKLSFRIWIEGVEIKWKDFKGTYLAEKISNYIKNTINGQKTFYWKNN